MEVVADHQMPDAQLVEQHFQDEELRVKIGDFLAEAHHQQRIDRQLGHLDGLLAQPGQARRRVVIHEIFQRLRFEDHHIDRQPQVLAVRRELFQHRLVPQVHAVEIAHGQHTAAIQFLQVLQSANDAHENRPVPKLFILSSARRFSAIGAQHRRHPMTVATPRRTIAYNSRKP